MKTTKLIPSLCVLVFTAQTLLASIFTFTGSINGQWEEPGNWLPDYPGMTISEGDLVIIETECTLDANHVVNHGGIVIAQSAKLVLTNGGFVENLNNMEIIGSLQLFNFAVLLNQGLFTIQQGGSVLNNARFENETGLMFSHGYIQNAGGHFQNGPFATFVHTTTATLINSGMFYNAGNVNINGSNFQNLASIQNDGNLTINITLDNFGDLNNNGSITVNGTLSNMPGGSLLNHAILDISPFGICYNNGIMNNFVFGEILNSGQFVCQSNSLFTNQGSIITYYGSLVDNYGIISNEGPIVHAGTFNNYGLLQSYDMIRNEGVIDNYAIFTMEEVGDLQLKSGSHFTSHQPGVLTIK